MRFADRTEAGRQLAGKLAELQLPDPVVLALPRGGVPVAVPVAEALNAPLDLVMVRKIGVPGHSELAAGAVVDGAAHQAVWNERILRDLGLSAADLQGAVDAQLAVIEDRRARYLGARSPVALAGRDVVIVDDGIATGATVKAALLAVRRLDPGSLTLAVPIAPSTAAAEFGPLVDYFVCLSAPEAFYAVGQGYARFGQTEDAEVVALLRQADERKGSGQ